MQLYINSLDQPVQHNYRYDHNNQVIWEFFEPETTYDYDSGGNRIETNGVTSTPGAGNRLLDDGTYTYAYDDEGNLQRRIHQTTGEQRDFFWDHRNRLVQIQSWTPGIPAEAHFQLDYQYDVFDRRVSRLETTYINGGTFPVVDQRVEEKYVYDGDNVVLDFRNVDGAGHQLARRYLYGAAVDQVLAQENLDETITAAARVYWLLPDNQGSIRDITDNSGAQVAHYMFDAFGRIHEGDPTFTRYLYTGREFDATSGLQYNRARWYDSSTGRFLSEDPIQDGSNWYAYVGNSGPNGTDPYGLQDVRLFSPSCVECVPRYRNHRIVGGMGGTNAAGAPLSEGIPILTALAGIFVEPVDWALTAYEIYNEPTSLWSYAGLIPIVPAAAGKIGKAVTGALYDVGRVSDLRKTPVEGTSVHHVPQSREAESLVGDFNVRNRGGNEIGVRLPNSEHSAISAAQALRRAPASARDLLAGDVRLLRRYTGMSDMEVRRLIQFVRDAHPSDLAPLHRLR